MSIKWRCKTCGALHEGQTALSILLSTAFVPVQVEDEKKKPVLKKPTEDEEEYADLKLD